MARRTQPWLLLLLALSLALLTVSLLACQVPGRSDSWRQGVLIISTPADGSASATPSFPPFTIGAWPSNSMPDASDRITIYVICRVQDPTMTKPSTPAIGLQVQVHLLDPINQSYDGTTRSDGIAMVPVTFNDRHPGLTVLVAVATTWHGVIYQSQTSFTPAPQPQPSPSPPSGGGTPSPRPGKTPSPTPRPGPPPTPPPTPAPTAPPAA
jgi:hypothetical protein